MFQTLMQCPSTGYRLASLFQKTFLSSRRRIKDPALQGACAPLTPCPLKESKSRGFIAVAFSDNTVDASLLVSKSSLDEKKTRQIMAGLVLSIP